MSAGNMFLRITTGSARIANLDRCHDLAVFADWLNAIFSVHIIEAVFRLAVRTRSRASHHFLLQPVTGKRGRPPKKLAVSARHRQQVIPIDWLFQLIHQPVKAFQVNGCCMPGREAD
jgi:hypothetical protein